MLVRGAAAVRHRCRTAVSPLILCGLTLFSVVGARAQGPLPPSTLAMRTAAGWQTFWRADAAPHVWRDAPLARAIRWRAGASGIQWGALDLAGSGEAWRTRLVVARVRPERVDVTLDTAFTADRMPAWTVDHAPGDAVLAVNAGQFEVSMPWGWVLLGGREWLAPAPGPLSASLVGEANGSVRWLHADEIAPYRATHVGMIRWAFQSYPALLTSDSVPRELRGSGNGVDVAHRDARAAICVDHAGNLLIALTRFNAVGPVLGFVPFGLTSPEMAGVMGALGCSDAMLLDGGISAQLMLRGADATVRTWRGVRHVPVGLVMRARTP